MSKIGTGHFEAMGRQGLRELRAAMYTGSNVSQTAEYGVFGTRTPGEVAEARRGETLDLEQEGSRSTSAVDQRLPQSQERSPEPRLPERGLDRG